MYYPDEDDTPTLPEVTSELPHPRDTCPSAPDWRHAPDPGTFTVRAAAGVTYLDVTCRYCGRSGCAGRLNPESKVQW